MAHVVVLATGGTIASTADASGGSVATRTIDSLLGGGRTGDATDATDVTVEGRDVLHTNSFLLTHRDLRAIAEAVVEENARGDVDGIVVTHGTDTLEETAFLVDLLHHGDKPVVFTGAQRAADDPAPDGPGNLRQAIAAAASPDTRGLGVLVGFAGYLYPARGTRKAHTINSAAFRHTDGGAIGSTTGDRVNIWAAPRRGPRQPPVTIRFDTTRVDVVVSHPGADAALAEAAVDAGAVGVILAGTGTGNANRALLEWARRAVAQGVSVGLSTRVAEGPVTPVYGNGGGHDLVAAGVVPYGSLPLPQARILASYLLSTDRFPTDELVLPYI
ncbi:asparaginase [Corynebacterium halotolerans]|uniref:asparaginase n=1 Tax=Corynebacterium halotolerans YIM 70093 = DSM 44683 TaxID=1121362 RepID=M1NVE1_9CORY|nr:asparaginase [Corynebacterium halotolerans]AGF71455.1 L-asparaginase [Corynebacterium halotolerans YIM 70093 = DSM 44683]